MTWDGGDESRVQALMAENERLKLHANSARVLLERYLAKTTGSKMLRTALQELDDACEQP